MKLLPAFLLAVACCSPTPNPKPVDPLVGAGCEEACKRADDLGCPEVLAPPEGTCVDACKNYEANGGDFCTGHLAGAMTCEQLARIADEGCE